MKGFYCPHSVGTERSDVLNIPILTQCVGWNASWTSQSVSWSRNCTSFVWPEQSVPCLQQNTARHMNSHYTFTNKQHRAILSTLLVLLASSILFSSPSGPHNSKQTTENWTDSMEPSPSWEANRYSASQEFHGTGKLATAFISVCQLFLSWASSIHSIHSYHTSWRSYYFSIYVWVSQVVSCPHVSPRKHWIRLSLPSYALHASLITFFTILNPHTIGRELQIIKSFIIIIFIVFRSTP